MGSFHRISLDAMGGDNGYPVVVEAAIDALQEYDDIELILVGDKEKLSAELKKHSDMDADRLRLHHASQRVAMDESPALALRKKKDSSMRVAINLVKQGDADAVVSAGNTGALMATARFVLRMLPGIDRPALCTAIPNSKTHTHMLDLGANIDSSAEHLYQFALMGSELVNAIDGIDAPRLGLLNIGEEEIKGNEQVKLAHELIKQGEFNYQGFVEGNDIFSGKVDLIVCDGFVGNVALKTTEGLAKMLSTELKAGFTRNILTKFAALVSMPVLKAFMKRFDHRRYNGASLLGLQGIVVKSHGNVDALAYAKAIGIARKEVKAQLHLRIKATLEAMMDEKIKD
ncbi:MAG TPA: phosphate acyltransferase PlsX [Leucothrix mucor]|uniref:Phosphate acyltransferase n=1 Tax=Leucothrix mucor TaxID=45248 RepID=A0A7V2WV59_LEUMU|nr:phosphate acyltransferase PlsX [Leucothrix mucor]